MTEKQYGYLNKDEDGHWYLIPAGMEDKFQNLLETMADMDYMEVGTSEECAEFERLFAPYRISGPWHLRIEMGQPNA